MIKKAILTFLICLIFVLGTFAFWYFDSFSKSINQIPKKVNVYVEGAVQEEGEINLKHGVTVFEAVKIAKPKSGIDWKALNISEKITRDTEIYVPYKEGFLPKIKLGNDVLSQEELNSLNVNHTIKKAIAKMLERISNPTWKDFDDIPGVGEKTLAILKSQLEI